LSLLKHHEKLNGKKSLNKQIDSELPYFITIVMLFATSGFGPYSIFLKIKDMDLLPNIRKESIKILKKIDMLGMDPLTVMNDVKNKNSSHFGEFLSGYVSSIQSGGDLTSYLKSKMDSTFALYENIQKQLVEKVKALVEAYMTLQVVVLAVYIIITATTNDATVVQTNSGVDPLYFVIIMSPIISVLFLFLTKSMNVTKIQEVDAKKVILFGAPAITISVILMYTNALSEYNLYILGISLIASSLWPALKFQKSYKFSIAAEQATSMILRDVAEARKAGLGPEKCIIHATKRKDFGLFNKVATAISNKLEWGIGLDDIFRFIKKETSDFQVLIVFRILFEVITSGGGNVNTLNTLADVSEKIQTVEKSKRQMLKPYVMVGFILVGITGFTTLLVIDSLTTISTELESDVAKKEALKVENQARFMLLGVAVLIQSWVSGLFLGKIVTGSYSGGFLYSVLLVGISLIAIAIIQLQIFGVAAIFG
jgi:archaeal flagellar protein FlaJ